MSVKTQQHCFIYRIAWYSSSFIEFWGVSSGKMNQELLNNFQAVVHELFIRWEALKLAVEHTGRRDGQQVKWLRAYTWYGSAWLIAYGQLPLFEDLIRRFISGISRNFKDFTSFLHNWWARHAFRVKNSSEFDFIGYLFVYVLGCQRDQRLFL